MSPARPADQYFDAAITLLQRVRDEEADAIAAAGDRRRRRRRRRRPGLRLRRRALLARRPGRRLPGGRPRPGQPARRARRGRRRRRCPPPSAAPWSGSTAWRAPSWTPAPPAPATCCSSISLSGRNALPVEMAQHARALGLTVVGVTSVAYARADRSRHASGHLPEGPLRHRAGLQDRGRRRGATDDGVRLRRSRPPPPSSPAP